MVVLLAARNLLVSEQQRAYSRQPKAYSYAQQQYTTSSCSSAPRLLTYRKCVSEPGSFLAGACTPSDQPPLGSAVQAQQQRQLQGQGGSYALHVHR